MESSDWPIVVSLLGSMAILALLSAFLTWVNRTPPDRKP